ncbi:hypothetical protein IBX65_03700 [Candidatus Aerophobetes bacterium]|nr:hypothetical protein [Candidatus Aerophobetes bacterium]
MSSERKGIRNIRTLRGRVDKCRAKTPQGALIELAQLAQKKARLHKEMKRWEEKIKQINSELEQIATMEEWLYRFVDGLQVPSCIPSESKRTSQATSSHLHEMRIQY